MFQNTFQTGFLTILSSTGSKPLDLWGQSVMNGHIRRVKDEDAQTLCLEVMGTNVATTYILCPGIPTQTLAIKLPFIVMMIKNMKKYFSFEIQIKDDKNMARRFRVSNYQSATRIGPFCTQMPIGLNPGWNQIQFNLADFTHRAYGSVYIETMRVQIHANVRIRRVYFCDRLYSEEELPAEFRMFVKEERKGSRPEPKKITKVISTDMTPSGAPPTPDVQSMRKTRIYGSLRDSIAERRQPEKSENKRETSEVVQESEKERPLEVEAAAPDTEEREPEEEVSKTEENELEVTGESEEQAEPVPENSPVPQLDISNEEAPPNDTDTEYTENVESPDIQDPITDSESPLTNYDTEEENESPVVNYDTEENESP